MMQLFKRRTSKLEQCLAGGITRAILIVGLLVGLSAAASAQTNVIGPPKSAGYWLKWNTNPKAVCRAEQKAIDSLPEKYKPHPRDWKKHEERACSDQQLREYKMLLDVSRATLQGTFRELQAETNKHVLANLRKRYRFEQEEHAKLKRSVSRAEQGLKECRKRALVSNRADAASQREELARLQASLDSCKTKLAERVAQRKASALVRPMYELMEIPERLRLPEESTRIEAHLAKQEAALEARRNDKRYVAPLLGAGVCYAKDFKKELAAEIREQLRYSRKYGGVVDKRKIYNLQEEIRLLDGAIREMKQWARARRVRISGCRKKEVRTLLGCLSSFGFVGPATGSCKDQFVKDVAEIEDMLPRFGFQL